MTGNIEPAGIPATVELAAGSTAGFILRGLGTAGYIWEASVEGPRGIVEVRLHHGGTDVPAATPGHAGTTTAADAPGGGRRLGAARPETLSVTGLAAGRVVVHLTQRRPWERGLAPRERHRIDVVVR